MKRSDSAEEIDERRATSAEGAFTQAAFSLASQCVTHAKRVLTTTFRGLPARDGNEKSTQIHRDDALQTSAIPGSLELLSGAQRYHRSLIAMQRLAA